MLSVSEYRKKHALEMQNGSYIFNRVHISRPPTITPLTPEIKSPFDRIYNCEAVFTYPVKL